MKDEQCIRRTIEHLKHEKEKYQRTFAGVPTRTESPNYDKAIENLEKELEAVKAGPDQENATDFTPSGDQSVGETADFTRAGDIGDEQCPAGEIKTDKHAWHYDASKNVGVDLPRKMKEFFAGF